MPKFVIERDMPGVAKLSDAEFQAASANSCNTLRVLGPEIQWIESFVTGDKIYCIYHAPSEDLIRRHAEQAGLPANKISKVERIISPATAEV
jgi:hypothetical protein